MPTPWASLPQLQVLERRLTVAARPPRKGRPSSSSSSSTQWKARQANDPYALAATRSGLRSRAAFKLRELDARFRLFGRGQRVVDLGFAPGSWSAEAVARVGPRGRVYGIDLLPAPSVRGMTAAIQGDFLDPKVRAYLRGLIMREDSDDTTGDAQTKGLVDVSIRLHKCPTSADSSQVVLSDMYFPFPDPPDPY